MTKRTIVFTYLCLLVLLSATVLIAYMPLGRMNFVLAMGISSAKAALIMLIFMELRRTISTTRVLVTVLLLWGVAFFALGFIDYLTRSWPLNPQRTESVPEPQG